MQFLLLVEFKSQVVVNDAGSDGSGRDSELHLVFVLLCAVDNELYPVKHRRPHTEQQAGLSVLFGENLCKSGDASHLDPLACISSGTFTNDACASVFGNQDVIARMDYRLPKTIRAGRKCVGHIDEWHVVFTKFLAQTDIGKKASLG